MNRLINALLIVTFFSFFSCNGPSNKKVKEPDWTVKYVFTVMVATDGRFDFSDPNGVEPITIADSDSKKAQKIKDYIDDNSKLFLDSLKNSKYSYLKEIEHKLVYEQVDNERIKDAFDFVLYATDEKDGDKLILDLVELVSVSYMEYSIQPYYKRLNELDKELDTLYLKMKIMTNKPREEINETELRVMEKQYSKLLELKTELSIARTGMVQPFFMLERIPTKIPLN